MIPLRSRFAPLAFALLCVSTFVQAAEFTLSPGTVAVGRGQQTAEIVATYQPGTGSRNGLVVLTLNLDQLGWLQAQPIDSTTADYDTRCLVSDGELRAFVRTNTSSALPTVAPIPVCRFRVRAHVHAIGGIHTIKAAAYEYRDIFDSNSIATNHVRVVVQ